MRRPRAPGGALITKLALAAGYLALGGAALVAHRSPASDYELSIYAETPIEFWLAVAVVAVVATAVALRNDRHLPLALLLGGMGALAVGGLPLLRGYHFYGRADSLIHLGWARGLNVGGDPFSLVYPGSHLLSVILSATAGVEITQAMMTVMLLFVLIFLLCVPLCVWFIVPDRQAFAIGAFSAFLLLPINNISTHLHFHTYSMTMLFVPFALYLTFSHLLDGLSRDTVASHLSDGGRVTKASTHVESVGVGLSPFSTVPTSYLLPLVSIGLVLFHPQVALNVLILMIGVVVVQLWSRRYRPQKSLGERRMLALQAGLLLLFFISWVQTHEGYFVRTSVSLFESVVEFVEGSGETTPRVESQTDSAESIGVNIWILFSKLFGIEVIYATVAAGVVLDMATGWFDRIDRETALQPSTDIGGDVFVLLLVGGLTLVPFFGLHLFGSISTYLFRHVGFSLMLVTILGAVGLRQLAAVLSDWGGESRLRSGDATGSGRGRLQAVARSGRSLVVVLVVVMVVALSVASLFPSPFISLSGGHVPEAEMDGYESAFASQPPDSSVWFTGVRTNTVRFERALYGAESAPWTEEVEPITRQSAPLSSAAINNGLPTYFATNSDSVVRRDHYVVISEADQERELGAYRGLRYSESAFESVDRQPGVGQIRDNGALTVYYVNIPEERPEETTTTDDSGSTDDQEDG